MVRTFFRGQWRGALFGLLVAALMLATAPVVAGIGDPVIQGQANSVNNPTTLRGSAAGNALLRINNKALDGQGIEIRVKPGQPPLVVNSPAKVKNLNADRLDGKSIGALMLKNKYDADKNLIVDDAEMLDGMDSADFVAKNGSWSCAGTAFEATSSGTSYDLFASLKFSTGPGGALFRCSVSLPDGVYVTSVTFAIEDLDATADVITAMWRTDLTGTVGQESNMSGSTSSGTPGASTLTDTSISNPLVDNARYAYFLQAFVGPNDDTGIYGATITYSTTPPAGAGPAGDAPANSSER